MLHNRTKRRITAALAALALTAGLSGAVIARAPLASADGVAFATGDVLASVGNGLVDNYSPSGTLLDTLNTASEATYTTGGCFDSAGNFYVTDFDSNALSKFSAGGNLLNSTWATESSVPESCAVDAKDNVYVGGQAAPTIYEYDSSGMLVNSFSVTGGSGTGGTDWLDVAADQCTILYTGEGSEILSYNVCTQTQNADFATGMPGPCYELRIRPNGDVMVACASEILRYSGAGALLQTYSISGSGDLFSMNLDPDNTTFWTGDDSTAEISHVDIATGAILGQFGSSPPVGLFGLTLVGAINVAQPTVTLSPPTATQVTGTSDTVTATITNPGGSIAGQTVSFSVSGANTASGTAVTSENGQATFSYSGTNTGTDTITATFLSGTGTASVTWMAPQVPPTRLATSLSGGGQAGTSISVPSGTAVTDTATLSGTNAAKATGSVTYNVYSDNECTTLVKAGTPQTITTAGLLPPSAAVPAGTAGTTYYWTASYSGDKSNGASSSPCGSESVTATIAPTTLATSLSGGGKSGAAISVTAGTAVTDSATLTGTAASGATGTVTYNVYADRACQTLVKAGTAQKITTAGVLPPSAAVTFSTTGTYYWQAAYSGDTSNAASTSPCGSEAETVTPAPTTLATSLSGGSMTGAAITVAPGTAVTDSAALSGAEAATASGTATYNVYSDAACTKLVAAGSAESISTPGTLPPSAPVTLTALGTYYWTASYSGDPNNLASASPCGSETETVASTVTQTSLATSLSGGGKSGTAISVTAGTTVTDSATLSGTNAKTATGSVIYNVYSDRACTKLVTGGTAQTITTPGTLPGSAAVTLGTAGTYYWTASYSGDAHNAASDSPCGSETETVTPAPTTLATSLSGGGKTGTAITVQAGTPVTDAATLSGAVAAAATGTVTYSVYSDSACTKLAANGGLEVVTGGKATSLAVALTVPGTYYWKASYSGDPSDLASASPCGAEKLTVTPLPAIDTLTTGWGKSTATARVSTTVAGDLIVAFVEGFGPGSKAQSSTVTGGGLAWHLVSRHDPVRSDTEVWAATAAGKLTGAAVTAKASLTGFGEVISVVAVRNATGVGPASFASAATGAPHGSLKTTVTNSWVFAVGADWNAYVKPTAASGQLLLSQVDAPGAKTAWVQATTTLTPKSGTTVTISDTKPANEPYDLLLVAIH